MYTMHTLPHRAQIMTSFQNDIPLKIRQGTVFDFSVAMAKAERNARGSQGTARYDAAAYGRRQAARSSGRRGK